MDTIQAIMTRRSVRSYLDKPVEEAALQTILQAAMAGPSCTNARDWQFIVVRDKELLSKMADANGRPADPLRRCSVGILICGDLELAFKPAPEYWVIDGAIAAQNMCLAAHALGLGTVWLGTWPQMERVDAQVKLFGLPSTVIPHSILALGYPDPNATEEPPGGPMPKDMPRDGSAPPPMGDMPPEGSAPPPMRPRLAKGAFQPERVHYDGWKS